MGSKSSNCEFCRKNNASLCNSIPGHHHMSGNQNLYEIIQFHWYVSRGEWKYAAIQCIRRRVSFIFLSLLIIIINLLIQSEKNYFFTLQHCEHGGSKPSLWGTFDRRMWIGHQFYRWAHFRYNPWACTKL